MSGISFTGLGSGLPVSDIVSGLVGAERDPYISRTDIERSELTTSISAVGALKSALDTLQSSFENLTSEDNFQQRSVSGTDEFVTVTSDKTAQLGQFDIKVNNLSTAHKVASTSFNNEETLGEGTLTIGSIGGEGSFAIDISDTDTLKDVRDKINSAADNESAIATILTDSDGTQRLIMSAQETGVENALEITVSGNSGRLNELDTTNSDPLTQLTQLTAAQDASITIDGAITITSSNNEFDDAIDGLTINLNKAHAIDDSSSSIIVSENNNIVEETLTAFVEAYNSYRTLSGQVSSSGDEDTNASVLSGDSLIRSLNSRLRSEFSSSFDTGDGGSLTLTQLGLEFDQFGVLSFDSDKLDEQLNESSDAVQALFLGETDSPGFAVSLKELLTGYTQSGGLLDGRIDTYNAQVDDLDEGLEAFNVKMASLEARLFSQFNAMDALVANLTSTTSGVLSQLANVPDYS